MDPSSCGEPWNRSVCDVVAQHNDQARCATLSKRTTAHLQDGAIRRHTTDINLIYQYTCNFGDSSRLPTEYIGYDSHKSTKGASKMRRDLINGEIAVLRDLLPLPASTRQRLSQLQLMALVCVYVRKANYFQQVFKQLEQETTSAPSLGFSKAMNGFILITCQNGKLLYISDNAAEYLGHSMEDLLIHGDSVYDIIDKQDHQSVQTELMRAPTPGSVPVDDTRLFLCRINVSRNARRQMRFGDQKVVMIRGHYLSYLPLCSRNEPVFVALCTPVVMPETRECVVQGATNVFTSMHSMDLKFLSIDQNGEFYLGYDNSSIQGLSWYQLLHWSNMKDAQTKHKLITTSEQDRSSILLLQLQNRSGDWIWVHCVLQVKENAESSQQPMIVCTCQVLSDDEALVMRGNTWLYHYYSMQGKLHYGLSYENSAHVPTYYQQMLNYPTTHHTHHTDPAMHPTYLQHQTHHHQQYSNGAAQTVAAEPQFAYPSAAYHPYTLFEPPAVWPRYDTSGYVPPHHGSLEPVAPYFATTTQHTPVAQVTQAQKRPPTPPDSPRRRMCASTVVPPQGSPQRDPLPIKRRLMAYHHQPGYGYTSSAGAWTERTSPRPAAAPGGEQRVEGHYGFSTSSAGAGHGGVEGGSGGVLVARPSPLRLHLPASTAVKSGVYTTPSTTPEMDLIPESLPWNLSPPWSECNQRVPDLTQCSDAATGGSPGAHSAEALTPDRRLALAGWADTSILYPFSMATPSPTNSGGSSSASEEMTSWRTLGPGIVPTHQQHIQTASAITPYRSRMEVEMERNQHSISP